MEIIVQTTSSIEGELLTQFTSLYQRSFPYEERRPIDLLLQNISQGITQCHIAFRGTQFLGFMTTQCLGDFYYCEYLVVVESFRGQQVGTTLLQKVLSSLPKPLVLEVEPPTDDITRSRIVFYEHAGFILCTKPYTQPSYHQIGLDAIPLCLMDYGDILIDHFDSVVAAIYTQVYGR